MERLVLRDEINIKLEPEYLKELSIDKIKKEINDTKSEETITPVHNAGQNKIEHDEINIKSIKIYPQKRYECKICNKKYQYNCLLNQHMKSHSGEKPYECSECSKKFSLKKCLKSHKLTHDPERMTFPCQFCNKEFKIKRECERHMKIHTRENLLQCAHCQKEFTYKYALVLHMKTHTQEEQFSCKFCDKKYSSKKTIKHHMNKHTRENLFKCSECDIEFANIGNLNRHLIQIHGKERPEFSCKFCDSKLKTKDGLKQHMNMHTRERLFKCSECNKEFTVKANLEQHLKIHARGIRLRIQFSCKFCDKKYSSKKTLKHHINKHTRENLFECSECDIEFANIGNLNRHLINIHGKERLQKISQIHTEETGDILSDFDCKSMNKCTTALSNIIKSETMGLLETDLTEYITTAQTEPNIEENESSHLAYNTCYSETICKEEVMLPDEND